MRRIEEVFDEIDESPADIVEPRLAQEFIVFRPAVETSAAGLVTRDEKRPLLPHPKNPLVIWNLKDLFSLCGPIATVFLVVQAVSALTFTHLMIRFLDLQHLFLDSFFLLSLFVLDGIAFVLYRGRIYTDWARPVVWLSILTIAPGIVAFVWCKILNLA